jgi:hypothetical protein
MSDEMSTYYFPFPPNKCLGSEFEVGVKGRSLWASQPETLLVGTTFPFELVILMGE